MWSSDRSNEEFRMGVKRVNGVATGVVWSSDGSFAEFWRGVQRV